MLVFFAATLIAGAGRPLSAAPGGRDSIVVAESWTIQSKILSEPRKISVHLPDGYAASGARYPVVYLLDGEQLLLPVSGLTTALAWSFKAPPMIVVAINNVSRARDFTVPWTAKTAAAPTEQRYLAQSGGADKFLAFLKSELVPAVESRYRAAGFRVLAGHSLGGLFALHAFASEPDLFRGVIAASPAAQWNGDGEVDRVNSMLVAGHDLAAHRLFVSVAEKEFDDSPRAIARLGDFLRASSPAGLQWELRTITGEDHGTAMVPAVYAGLEFMFADYRLPTAVFDQGLDSTLAYYQRESRDYGFTMNPMEGDLFAMVQRAAAKGDTSAARAAYDHKAHSLSLVACCSQLRPYKRSAHSFLGGAVS
ncbi:MAG: alpha/beta hydrolase [Gemmatimonadaceae bacterium]